MKKYWNDPVLSNYNGKAFTFKEVAESIERFHIAFQAFGLKKGDKVALCGRNCAEWGIAFLGVATYEAVCVPLLNDFLPESVAHLTDHSESKVLFTDKAIWEKLDKSKMPLLEAAIAIDDYEKRDQRNNDSGHETQKRPKPMVCSFRHSLMVDAPCQERMQSIAPENTLNNKTL